METHKLKRANHLQESIANINKDIERWRDKSATSELGNISYSRYLPTSLLEEFKGNAVYHLEQKLKKLEAEFELL